MPDHRANEDRVGAYWEALVQGQDAAGIELDPELAEAIRRFQAWGVAPASTARDRVWRKVQTASVPQQKPESLESEDLMLPSLTLDSARPFASAIGPGALPLPRWGRMRWALTQLATAALLVLTLVAGLVAFGPWRPGSPAPASSYLAVIRATPPADERPDALAAFVAEIPFSDNLQSAPSGVAVDASGTLYVIDSQKDQIQVFDRDGNPVATWGETGANPGQFQFRGQGFAWGDLAIGPDGNFYVMDAFNSRIQVLAPDGAFLREWGEPGAAAGQFDAPAGITVDGAGRVYVTEKGNARLQIFDREGQFLAAWDGSEAESGPFQNPGDVAVDATGIVSVTDFDTGRIVRFDAEGTVIDAFGETGVNPGQFMAPWGVAVDTAGNLYVAEFGGNRVQVVAPDGTALGTVGSLGTQAGQFNAPIYLTISPDGMLYVADESNRRVQVFRLLPPLAQEPITPVSG